MDWWSLAVWSVVGHGRQRTVEVKVSGGVSSGLKV